MSCCKRALANDRRMMFHAVACGLACIALFAVSAGPFLGLSVWGTPYSSIDPQRFYLGLFLLYAALVFVMSLCSAAIIARAKVSLSMLTPPPEDDVPPLARIPALLLYSLIASSLGLILRIVETPALRLCFFQARLIRLNWSLNAVLSIPLIVYEDVGAIESLRKSSQLLKRVWGRQLYPGYAFGAVFFILGALGLIPLWAAVHLHPDAWSPALFALFIYWICLGVIRSVLEAVFQAALYRFARSNEIARDFSGTLLDEAVMRR